MGLRDGVYGVRETGYMEDDLLAALFIRTCLHYLDSGGLPYNKLVLVHQGSHDGIPSSVL